MKAGAISVWGLFLLFGMVSLVYASGSPMPYQFGSPYKESLPADPVEKAAVLGLFEAYLQSKMYEIKQVKVLSVKSMIPTEAFVAEHDPRELYCVCVDFQSRYKVPWSTGDSSPWLRTIQNILVMQTRGGHYLAMRSSGICPEFCR